MAVKFLGYEVNGVYQQEMPDSLWEKIERAICEIHGLVKVEDEEQQPDDPPAA